MSLPRIPQVLVLPVATAAVLLGGCAKETPRPTILSVATEPVSTARFADRLDTISTLESIGLVSLAARASGRIERLFVQEGQLVRRGQPLLALDQTQQRAELASARADRDEKCLNYRRFSWLARQGAASELQRDSSRAACLKAREDVLSREATLGFSNLAAPIDGEVSDLVVREGDVIQQGDPFTKILRNERLFARVEVPAVHSSRVRLGQTVLLQAPDGSGTVARGTVDFVDPNVAASTQGLLVKTEIPNPTGNLRNGLRLRSTLIFETREQASVPFAAVTQSSGQSFVFTVGTLADLRRNPGQIPAERLKGLEALPAATRFALQTPVKLGPLQENRYPILSGVASGTRVITTNLLRLSHGTPVKPE